MQFYCVAIVGPPTGSIKQASAFALAHNSIFRDTKMSPERPYDDPRDKGASASF
jgi:hypothetical protein